MSIESGGYFGSNSAEKEPMPIQRYSLDRLHPVMDVEDDGEWCRWDDVRPFVENEPCEYCHLSPLDCQGLTLKQACEKIYRLKDVLKNIVEVGDFTSPEGMKDLAKVALEI